MDNGGVLGKATEGEADITLYLITITLSDSGFDEWRRLRAISLQAVNGNGSWMSGERDKKQCINTNRKLSVKPASATRRLHETETKSHYFVLYKHVSASSSYIKPYRMWLTRKASCCHYPAYLLSRSTYVHPSARDSRLDSDQTVRISHLEFFFQIPHNTNTIHFPVSYARQFSLSKSDSLHCLFYQHSHWEPTPPVMY